MSDEDQFAWLAHEATADLNLSPAKEQEWADLLKRTRGIAESDSRPAPGRGGKTYAGT
jgi:hypothetical protein